MPVIIRCAAALAVVVCLAVRPAGAQTFTWNNPAGGNWNLGTNWLGGAAPTSGTGATLFFGDPTPFSGGYTATNNLGAFTFNSLAFGSEALPGSATAITIAGDATNPLRLAAFSGVLPTISQGGSGAAAIGGVVEFVNDTTVGGLGSGLLSFTGTLSGSGRLIINRPVLNPFGGGGYTVLGPSNSAAFSGGVTLTSGNLVLAGSQPLGTGQFTIDGITITVQFGAANVAIANTIQLNATMNLTGVAGGTFTGAINGSAGIVIAPRPIAPSLSTVAFSFQGSNGFTGPLTVRPIGFASYAAMFSGANGTARSSSEYIAYPRGTLGVDNSGTNVINRLNTAATLTLNGGGFQLIGNSASASSESLAILRTTSQGEITVIGGGSTSTGSTATLIFGSWDRQQNSVAQFTAPGLGSAAANAAQIVVTANPGGAVGGTGGPGTTTQAILPYAVANLSTNNPQRELVRYNPANGRMIPLFDDTSLFPGPGDEYAKNLYLLAGTSSFANVKVSDSIGGLNGSTAINALVLNSVNSFAGTSEFGASVHGAGTLSITGGVILTTESAAGFGTPLPYQTPGIIGVSNLAFGSQTGYLHVHSNLAITSDISGTGGIVKGGDATLSLTRANSLSGGLTINGGAVTIGDEAALGSGPLTLAGSGGLSFGLSATLTDGNPTAFTLTRPVSLGLAGGGLAAATSGQDTSITISGAISGPGQLLVGGGLVRLTNTANSYTGGTLVAQGTLALSSDNVLGPGTLTLTSNSTIQVDAPFTINRPVLLQGFGTNPISGTMTFFTNGNDLSIGGIITSSLGATAATQTGILMKAGNGTLNLTAANTYTGLTIVGDATPLVRVGNPTSAQTGGTLLLSGPNGAIPLTSAVTVNPGSSVILDYSSPNTNRIGSVPFALNGGQLMLLGATGVAATESLGTVTVSGGVGTILLGQSTDGSVVLSLGGLAVSATNPGIAVIRGDVLGGSSPRFTRVQFGTAPTLVNNIIPFAVGGASASPQPTDFVTIGANGVQLFTAYGSLAAPGPTVTADQSGGLFTLTGATSLNALRLGTAGAVDLNGFTLTMGSGTQAGAILARGGTVAVNQLIGGTLAFGTRTASITAVNDLTISSTITGTGGLAKAGAGTLTLSGNGNALTGPIAIGEGTLRYANVDALPDAAGITVNAGATLDFGNFMVSSPVVASINGFGRVHFDGSLVINGSGTANNSTIGGPLTGGGTLTKGGTATLTLAGDNSGFSGSVLIRDGLLRVETPTALGTGTSPIVIGSTTATATAGNGLSIGRFVSTFNRAIDVQPTAAGSPAVINTSTAGQVAIASTINLNANVLRLVGLSFFSDPSGSTADFTGPITGSGRLEIANGMYRLSGNNTFSGGTTFLGGASTNFIGVGHDAAFGSGPISINTPGAANAAAVYLRADGGARSIANPIVFNPFSSLIVVGSNDLTLSGPIDFGGATRILNSASTGLTTLTGVLSNGGFSKSGVGTLVIANSANTASEASGVLGGMLMVNGTFPAIINVAGGGVTPVSRGGMLAGTGTVGGIELHGGTVAPGGNPTAPGNGIGILTSTGNLRSDFLAFGTLSFDVNGTTPGTGHDQLVVGTAGQATIVEIGSPAGRGLTLQVRLGFDPTGSSIMLIDNRGTAAIDGRFADLPEGVTFVVGQFAGVDYQASITYLGGTGNDVVLHSFQPVPEPVSVLAICAATGAAGVFRRRFRRAD